MSVKQCECGCGAPTTVSNTKNVARGYEKGVARRFLPGHFARVQHDRSDSATKKRLISHRKIVGDCWNWTGANVNGYGVTSWNGSRNWRVHRLAWTLWKGPIPKGSGYHGTCVLHRCDNPSCFNPEHLFLGSNADNIRDMFAKGRGGKHSRSGHLNGRSKITADQVLEIRKRYAAGGVSQQALADEYGLIQNMISKIILRKAWTHI